MSQIETSEQPETAAGAATDFDLTSFFPYQVRVYYRSVSESVTAIYETLFGLSVSEWRTMAVLGASSVEEVVDLQSRYAMGSVDEMMSESAKLTGMAIDVAQKAAAPFTRG